MYRPQLTPSQMEEASRKATAEGMREVAEALSKKNKSISDTSDSDDDVKISKQFKPYIIHKTQVSNKNASIEKLESQIHYLRLDLANTKVEADDARNEVTKYKDISNIYMKINNEFGFIRSAIERSKKNIDDLSLKQFKKKVALFIEEVNEHVVLCESSINKIELHEIKFALERIIIAEKKKIDKYKKDLKNQILWTEMKIIVSASILIIFIIIGILSLIYAFYNKYKN